MVARSIVPSSEVDDLTQDAALSIIAAGPDVSGDVKSYLAKCVYMAYAKWRERSARSKRDGEAVCINDDLIRLFIPVVQPNQLPYVELRELRDIFVMLPKNWQVAISLAVVGMTVSEIARETGCTRNSVAIWLSNGRRVLSNPDFLGSRISTRGGITERGATNYRGNAVWSFLSRLKVSSRGNGYARLYQSDIKQLSSEISNGFTNGDIRIPRRCRASRRPGLPGRRSSAAQGNAGDRLDRQQTLRHCRVHRRGAASARRHLRHHGLRPEPVLDAQPEPARAETGRSSGQGDLPGDPAVRRGQSAARIRHPGPLRRRTSIAASAG